MSWLNLGKCTEIFCIANAEELNFFDTSVWNVLIFCIFFCWWSADAVLLLVLNMQSQQYISLFPVDYSTTASFWTLILSLILVLLTKVLVFGFSHMWYLSELLSWDAHGIGSSTGVTFIKLLVVDKSAGTMVMMCHCPGCTDAATHVMTSKKHIGRKVGHSGHLRR